MNKILALVKEVLEMTNKKSVNWNVEKNEEIRIYITDKKGYKTQILMNVSLNGNINVFYFSDEAQVIDCMNKFESKAKVE